MEATIILSIIEELRHGLALDIDPSPSFTRKHVPMGSKESSEVANTDPKYLVLGDSVGLLMARALERAKKQVDTATVPEWRVNSGNVALLKEKAMAAINEQRPTMLIFIGLEESFYMAQDETGHTLPARKAPDGHFHVDGELIVGGKDVQMKLFKLLDPIWDLEKDLKMVVISPMPRYITGSCCNDPQHIPNRSAQNYESGLRSGLEGVKNAMKAYLHSGGHHNCRVLDAAMDMEGLEKDAIWEADHKTPRPEVFDKMVRALEMVEVRIPETRKRPAAAKGGEPKKARVVEQPRQDFSPRTPGQRGGGIPGRGGWLEANKRGSGGPRGRSDGHRDHGGRPGHSDWRGRPGGRNAGTRGWRGLGGGQYWPRGSQYGGRRGYHAYGRYN
jgi:hypothetical protein